MDVILQTGLTALRSRDSAVTPLTADASAPGPASGRATQTAVAVPPVANADESQLRSKRRGERESKPGEADDRKTGDVGEMKKDFAAPASEGRYKMKIDYDDELGRDLLKIVDEKTEQTIVSLPPEELAKMIEEAKALFDGRKERGGGPVRDRSSHRLDTAV